MNQFENDESHISLKWLLRLVNDRGMTVQHLLKISHQGGGKSMHYVAILTDGRYICDCCMGLNLGIPCRHFFQALTKVQGLKFHIGLVRPRYVHTFRVHLVSLLTSCDFLSRWYQDPDINIDEIQAVGINDSTQDRALELQSTQLPHLAISNPLDRAENSRASTAAPTQTVGARTVYREAQEALRPLIASIQNIDELENLVDRLDGLR